jgi:hypothetical protein
VVLSDADPAAGGHDLLCEVGNDAGALLAADWRHAMLSDLTLDQQVEVARDPVAYPPAR